MTATKETKNTTERADLLRASARSHARSVVAPGVAVWDAARKFPRDAVLDAGKAGLCSLFAPDEAGGQGIDFEDGMAVFEELGRADASYAFALSMHNAVSRAVTLAGSEAVRERWTPGLVSGASLGGVTVTEPHAGSDAAAITTRAESHGDGYRLFGRKAWVTLVGEADVYLLACRRGSGPGHADMMMVVLPADRPGLRTARIYDKMASAFLPIGELELDGVKVTEEEVLAPPGQGFQAALGAIEIARVDIAAISIGLAAEALDIALRYARERRAFGQRLLDLQAIQFSLADIETSIVAGRMLYRLAAAHLGSAEGRVLAAHAKRFCPDAALQAATACSEVLGAYGWLNDTPLPRFMALAKMLQVVDGTTEIQRLVIARDLEQRAARSAIDTHV